jgi:hypothetical protein
MTNEPSRSAQRVTRRTPDDLGPGVHAWYYESRRGVELIVQTRDAKGQLIAAGSPVIRIPWGMLLRSAARCGRSIPSFLLTNHRASRKARR